MARSINTTHQNVLRTARQRQMLDEERHTHREEIALAKRLQAETGCKWSEAIKSAIGNSYKGAKQ